MTYALPQQAIQQWSALFTLLEENKRDLGIEEYCISKASLQQVPTGCTLGGLIIRWQWDFRENPPKKHKKGLKTAQKSQKSANGSLPSIWQPRVQDVNIVTFQQV